MRPFALVFTLFFAATSPAAAHAVKICTMIADVATGTVLVEEGDCRTRVTPASTFKLPLAVMGYDAGFLRDADHPVLAFREGDPDWGGFRWRRDTDPADWIRYSVVWYSQRITHALGAEALTDYAGMFAYGNADFGGDPGYDNGLDRAWIASSLQISPYEQVRFLRALVLDALPVRADAMSHARELVAVRAVDDWMVHGKTGAAYPRRADRSFDYARAWGWYVGWAEKDGRALVFARLTQAREHTKTSPGVLTKEQFVSDWPELAGRIE